MKTEEYDESKVLSEYLTRNFSELMTDLERRRYELALTRAKAKHSDAAAERAERLPAGIAGACADAATASLRQFQALGTKLRQRILRDVWAGRVIINRCPACSRIVKTPLARQCLWCGCDWHRT